MRLWWMIVELGIKNVNWEKNNVLLKYWFSVEADACVLLLLLLFFFKRKKIAKLEKSEICWVSLAKSMWLMWMI